MKKPKIKSKKKNEALVQLKPYTDLSKKAEEPKTILEKVKEKIFKNLFGI